MDFRYAWRMFARQPAFALTAVATLALGIGANTAIFTVVNGILLRPLPYKDPDRLVMLWMQWMTRGGMDNAFSPDIFAPLAERTQSFEDLAAYQYESFNLTGDENPERVQGITATTAIFRVLGATAERGRTFLPDEERVAVLSHQLWERRFGGDASLIGKKITLSGDVYTVIGILPAGFDLIHGGNMPRGFRFASRTEVWVPLVLDRKSGRTFLQGLGRLRRGLSLPAAQAEFAGAAASVHRDHTDLGDFNARIVPLQTQVTGRIRPTLFLLMGAVGFVLLIVCANVANLLIARAPLRQREIAVRAAMGAAAWRIVRQLLTESLLLGLIGGALGWLLALWGVDTLARLAPEDVPSFHSGVDARVLAFSLLASALASVLFGLLPAAHLAGADLHTALKLAGRTSGGRSRLRNALVVMEMALSLVLLTGAGLLLRSFVRLLETDPGFRPDHVLTAQLAMAQSRYPRIQEMSALMGRALDNIARIPGVEAAGGASVIPMGGLDRDFPGFQLEDRAPLREDELGVIYNSWIGGDYFRALRIPLRYGRYFGPEDRTDSAKVAILSESLARRLWGSLDPVGRNLVFWFLPGKPKVRLVGVVADVKHSGLDLDAPARIYLPASQVPIAALTFLLRPMTLVVRTATPGAVREAVLAADRDQPVSNFRTMESLVGESLAGRKFLMILLGLFAAMAVVLAGVGLYGVVSYAVTARTAEIGVRMALGARSADVLRMVLQGGLALALAGVALGTIGALALSRLIAAQLYGVHATDAITFAAVAVVLVGIALIATLVPALRAARVDPMVALRQE